MTWLNARAPQIEARYGRPAVERIRWDASNAETALLQRAAASRREHDVTLFIQRGDAVAVIRKHDYPPLIYRPPSGGVEPHESLETGSLREAYEETGLVVALRAYLVRARVAFEPVDETLETISWTSHVFLAEWLDGEPHAVDTKEIERARWASFEEISTTLQLALDTAPTAGLRYRGWLQRRALRALRERDASRRQ